MLEVITESAREIAGADTSSLHYPLQSPLTPNENRYMHEVWAGKSPPQTFRPRVGGLGERAIRAGEPQFLRYTGQADVSETVTFNPKVYAAGIRSLAAFPLIVEKGPLKTSVGVLYVGLRDNRDFSDDEIAGLTLYTRI